MPAERLRLRLQYRTDLFERSTVEAIGRRLVALLEAVVADPSQPIGRIDLLAPEERRQILFEWNARPAICHRSLYRPCSRRRWSAVLRQSPWSLKRGH